MTWGNLKSLLVNLLPFYLNHMLTRGYWSILEVLQLYMGWIHYGLGPCLPQAKAYGQSQSSRIHTVQMGVPSVGPVTCGMDMLWSRSIFSQFPSFSYTWGEYIMIQVHVYLRLRLMGYIYRSPGVLWSNLEYPRSPWSSLEYTGVSQRSLGVPWSTQGVPWSSLEYLRGPLDFPGVPGVSQRSLEFSGVP